MCLEGAGIRAGFFMGWMRMVKSFTSHPVVLVEPNPENRNDWLLFEVVMCRGKILWRWPEAI
ncbi:unnamed protein product, partial [Brassica oleracea var. botrytis]